MLFSAFPVGADGKVSVYQTDELDDPSIWELGTELNPTRRLHGRGDLTRETIESVELSIEIEGPHPLHRNIEGWPTAELEQLNKAQVLADMAKLILA